MVNFELLVLVVIIIALLRRGLSLLSPVMIIVYVYLLAYLGGFYFYDPNALGVSAIFDTTTSTSYNALTMVVGLLIATTFGAHISLFLNKRIKLRSEQVLVVRRLDPRLIYIPIAASLLYFVGSGPIDVLYRETYFADAFHVPKLLGTAMLIPSAAILGYFFASQKGQLKTQALIIFVIVELLFLSLSTRLFALAPILFALGGVLAINSRQTQIRLAVAVLIAPFLLMIPIKLRSDHLQGLLPLISKTFTGDLFDEGFTLIDSMHNLFFFSFPLLDYTINYSQISLDYILVSLNPMPGVWTDWYSMIDGVNESTPYAGVGELINFSFTLAIAIYFVLGLYITSLETLCIKKKEKFLLVASYLFFLLFTVTSMQYTFRSASRYMYYLLAIQLMIYVYRKFKRRTA